MNILIAIQHGSSRRRPQLQVTCILTRGARRFSKRFSAARGDSGVMASSLIFYVFSHISKNTPIRDESVSINVEHRIDRISWIEPLGIRELKHVLKPLRRPSKPEVAAAQ